MTRLVLWLALVSVALLLGAEVGADDEETTPEAAIARVLDGFHDAASQADAARYFDLLTDDAVFLGTDATERWPKTAFEAFVRPYFAKGKGWTYRSTQRHTSLAPDGEHAFFDELLDNEHYGACRGSGVLRLDGSRWRIAQYNLSIPMPNALAKAFVGRIRAHARGATGVRTIYVVRHAETEGDDDNRPLSARGHARAKRLAALVRSAGIETFIASKYLRTQQTIQPAAGPRGVTQDAREMKALAEDLLRREAGSALVAGDRNTVPELLRALGIDTAIEIGERDHDNVFVVTLPPGGTPTMRRLHLP